MAATAPAGSPATGGEGRRARGVAWSAAGLSVLVWVVILAHLANPSPLRIRLGWGAWTLTFLGCCIFAILLTIVGALIVTARPRNGVGWVHVVGGVALSVGALGLMIGAQSLADPGAPAFTQPIAYVAAAGLQASLAFFALVPLWFPDGARSAGRWRPVAWLIALAVGVRFLEIFFQQGFDWLYPDYPIGAPRNPFEADGLAGAVWRADHPIAIGWWLSFAALALAAASLVARHHRSVGVERRQLAWFTAAVVLITPVTLAFIYVLVALPPATTDADAVIGTFFLSLTVPSLATLVAIRRYRLYEIDRIVNRALVYGAVTAILGGVFAASSTVTQEALSSVTGQSGTVAIVLTTLLVTTGYQPIRTRVERVVTRYVRFADPRWGAYRDELTRALELFDPAHAAARLVREGVEQLHAIGGAALLEVDGELRVCATVGSWSPDDTACIVPIGTGASRLGELHLGPNRAREPYRDQDVAALAAVADLAAEAIIAAETASLGERRGRLFAGRPVSPP